MEMTKKIYLETLKSVLGRSILHYYWQLGTLPEVGTVVFSEIFLSVLFCLVCFVPCGSLIHNILFKKRRFLICFLNFVNYCFRLFIWNLFHAILKPFSFFFCKFYCSFYFITILITYTFSHFLFKMVCRRFAKCQNITEVIS